MDHHQLSSHEEVVEIPMPINSAYGGMLHGYNNGIVTNKQVDDQHQQGYNGNFIPPGPKDKDMVVVRYRECQKNHAASIGGNALDGCGEFMASCGDQDGLTCSVCNCHRNFHRKEIEGEQHNFQFYPPAPHNALMSSRGRKFILGSPAIGSQFNVIPMMNNMACMNGNDNDNDNGDVVIIRHLMNNQVVKKRFRTKFSQEQKEKMLEFAERIGWKFQKQDESVVQQFCQEIGVKRRVLKVWMHNNKHTLVNKSNDLLHNNNNNSSSST